MLEVRESFQRARRADFARLFYDDLLASDSLIRRSFEKTNFESQRSLLVHGIYSMLDFYEGKELGRMAIARLSKSHGPGQLDVSPAMFEQWMTTFHRTMAVSDPEWTDALSEKWERALRPAIEVLKSAHHPRPR
jgi:hypothetical protein